LRVRLRVWLVLLAVAVVLSLFVYLSYSLAAPGAVAALAAVATGASYLAGWRVVAYTLTSIGLAMLAAGGAGAGACAWAALLLAAIVAGSHAGRRPGGARLAGSEGLLRVAVLEASAASLLAAAGFAAAAATLALAHYRPTGLPYPLSTLLDVAGGSIVVRLAGVAALAALTYYIVARLAQPIAYALTASREQLGRTVEGLVAREARHILAWRTWYHRLLYIALSAAGGVAGSAVVYAAASESIRLILGLESLPPLSMALLWAASFLASYLGAVAAVGMVRGVGSYWGRLAVAGATLLAAYTVAVVVVGGVPAGEALRLLYAPLTGSHPFTLLDLKLAPRILHFELELRQSFMEVEYIARFIARLLWG
jgi:hypothetical protein